MTSSMPLSSLVTSMKNGTTTDQNQDGRGYPVTRIETISDGSINLNRVRHVELDDHSAARWSLSAGDILLSHINSPAHIGKSAIYMGYPERLIHGMNLLLLRPDTSIVIPQYLHFGLRSSEVRKYIRERCKQAVNQASINQKELGAIRLPVPSLAEQQRIVDLLTQAESIVRLRREAQKKAAELVPAIFLEMFGDPRTNPKNLPVYAFGDLMLSPPTLGTMAKPSSSKARWLDLRVANIQRGKLTLEDQKWLDLSAQEIDRFQLVAGDVILARAIGSLDHLGKAVVVYPDGDWAFDSHLMRLRLDPQRILPEWFVPYLSSEGGRAEFLKHTRHSAVQFNVNGKEIRRLHIPLP